MGRRKCQRCNSCTANSLCSSKMSMKKPSMTCCSTKYQFRIPEFSRPTANAQSSLKPKRMRLYGVLPRMNSTVPCISMSAASAANGDRMVILSFEHA